MQTSKILPQRACWPLVLSLSDDTGPVIKSSTPDHRDGSESRLARQFGPDLPNLGSRPPINLSPVAGYTDSLTSGIVAEFLHPRKTLSVWQASLWLWLVRAHQRDSALAQRHRQVPLIIVHPDVRSCPMRLTCLLPHPLVSWSVPAVPGWPTWILPGLWISS